MRGERLLAPALTLLVVLSMVGGGVAPAASPVGTASAQGTTSGPCDSVDWLFTFLTPVGSLLTEDCSTAGEIADEWNETDAQETKVQIHSQAGQLAAGNEQFLTGMGNALTDSNTVAFSKGEAAAVETLANGGTVSEAQQAANESIEDYYAVKQINVVDRWNVVAETVVTLDQRAANTTGVSDDFVTLGEGNSTYGGGNYYTKIQGDAGTSQVTVLNGTSVLAQNLEWEMRPSSGGLIQSDSGNFVGEIEDWKADYPYKGLTAENMWVWKMKVRPTESLSSTQLANIYEFQQTYRQIENRSQQTKEEVAVYVEESLGPAVQNGNLNATSYVSPATLAQEYAQEYGNGSSYIRATAIAAYSGMSTPDLENTGSMTISHDGSTYEGLLLSQEGPSGGWQSGETYDPALLSGIQMFAVAGSDGEIVELDGSFTVESVQNTQGEEIDKATTINVTYETSNASANYTQLQQQIRDLNKQIEERQAAATSGGSDVQSGTNPLDALASFLGVSVGAAVVVLAAAALLAYRFYGPS